MRYGLFLFDFDGTIGDTRPGILHSLRRSFESFGVEPPARAELEQAIQAGVDLESCLRMLHPLGPRLDRDEVECWATRYREIYQSEGTLHCAPFEGMPEVIESLASRGLPCAIVSNKGRRALIECVRRCGISRWIPLVIGVDPGSPRKPNPTLFEREIAPHYRDIPRCRTLVIGDTPGDIVFARNSGLSSCWVTYGYGQPESCRGAKPSHIIDTPLEILGL